MAVPRQHKEHAPASVACGVVTSSDSRSPETDKSGRLIQDLLRKAGHRISFYAVVKDDAKAIADAVDQAAETCDAIITNGGTGIAGRDVTIPALAPRFERVLPGFGELFRRLSYDSIGSAAWLSGATAGVYRGRIVFCLPGSPDACRLAVEKLILPELPHAVGVMRR
jgi:molybdenum cofactor biosynthesis protein B